MPARPQTASQRPGPWWQDCSPIGRPAPPPRPDARPDAALLAAASAEDLDAARDAQSAWNGSYLHLGTINGKWNCIYLHFGTTNGKWNCI